MSSLHLNLKAEYFDAIAAGEKREEYRLATPYWRRRLEGRQFAGVVLKKGYRVQDEIRAAKPGCLDLPKRNAVLVNERGAT